MEFKQNKIKNEIVVVDDSSPDGTADIVKQENKKYKNIALVSRPPKSGIGSAHRDGIKAAKGNIIIAMDPDFSHPPSKIPQMCSFAKRGYLVAGSRFIKKDGFNTLFYRRIGTTLLNLFIRILFHSNISDYSNGYIAAKKEYLEKIIAHGKKIKIHPYRYVLWGIPVFTIGTKLGYKGANVFTPYVFRTEGETKIHFTRGLKIWLSSILLAIKLFIKL